MLHLFTVYWKIKPEYLLECNTEVETFILNLSDPIDTICNKIEDLAEFAKLALRPFSEQQLTNFAFIIINKQTLQFFQVPYHSRNCAIQLL